ncbi:heparinase II/III family protein [Neobacillus niacini]|uniref:heparinase II/III family protein n=1 Tax=Neobacillus niacini TaxID=86668 RepID=UPI002FFDD7DA
MLTAQLKSLLGSGTSLLFPTKESKLNWWKDIRENPAYQLLLNEIRDEGDRLLKESDPELTFSLFKIFDETGSRLEFEKVYFEKRRRLTTFAIMVLLEPEQDEYLTALENTIWSLCNEYSWCLPAHLQNSPETSVNVKYSLFEPSKREYSIDLFAAETAFSLSEIVKLTEEHLNPQICKRIYEEIYNRIFFPFKEKNFGWEKQTHNWAAVCAGSIGSAALHLIQDQDELAIILERVIDAMSSYLKGFQDDGICLEGYGYWQYGFGYYVYFADLLKKKTEGRLNLFDSEKVHQIALFQQRTFLNQNLVVNFSDSLPTASVFLGLSHYLSKIYSDFEVPENSLRSHYTDDHCSRWAPAIRNLLWFDADSVPFPWRNGTYFSKDSEWLLSRHICESGGFAFAAKGGHNDEPHNHNDIGHFILQGNTEVFFKDLGSGLYSKDYFSEKRYSYFCNGSQGHSVPIINEQFQLPGSAKYANILDVSIGEDADIFEMDIANAYEVETLQRLKRRFTWVKTNPPKLVLEDTYSFAEQPRSIVERFITPVLLLTKTEDGVILEGKNKVRISYDTSQLKLETNLITFINHFGKSEDNLALDFIVLHPDKECSVELAFQFI